MQPASDVASRSALVVIPVIVDQHAEECAVLHHNRATVLRSPEVRLSQLDRFDERLAAHLDGLRTAGKAGQYALWRRASGGELDMFFACMVLALERDDEDEVSRILSLLGGIAERQAIVVAALGWSSPHDLRGIVSRLLTSVKPHERATGLIACLSHGVDPGSALVKGLTDNAPAPRAAALRAAGVLGRRDCLPSVIDAFGDADPACRVEAIRAACRLGAEQALIPLEQQARGGGAAQREAIEWFVRLAPLEAGRTLLAELTRSAGSLRLAICGIAATGDSRFVPWLIGHAYDAALARLVGEAVQTITGLDIATPGFELLERPKTDDAFDDPNDTGVALDEDEGLAWPVPARLESWWEARGKDLPVGRRYFLGREPSRAHCLDVLRNGTQRQRARAAEWLCILNPGTPLFNTAAPAWRQQRLLDQMSA